MPENDVTKNEPAKAKDNDGNASRADFRWVAVPGGVVLLFVALLFISIFLTNMSERVKFFTANALTLSLLVVAGVQAYIYRRQWAVLERQAKAVEDQVAAMQAQLVAMSRQADIMNESLQQTRSMIWQNDRAINAARDTARAAEDSVNVAEVNAEIAQQNMIYAQRAYVGIPKGEGHIRNNVVFFSLTLVNSGQTPATKVRIGYRVQFGKQAPTGRIKNSSLEWTNIGVIAPGAEFKQTAESEPMTKEASILGTGGLHAYCRGVVYYRDIFEEERQTTFCFSNQLSTPSLKPCETGNDMQ